MTGNELSFSKVTLFVPGSGGRVVQSVSSSSTNPSQSLSRVSLHEFPVASFSGELA